jgi:hypothetical protein
MPAGADVTVPVPAPVLGTMSVFAATAVKVAVTALAALIVTEQVPVPVQAPLQPAKEEALPDVAVSVTTAPVVKLSLQIDPQLMPVGNEVTVPVPAPAFVTVRSYVPAVPNVAVTLRAALIVTVQLPVPEHAPLHPPKLEPEAGVAVNVTTVPEGKLSEQSVPQLIPAGEDETVPLPTPAAATVRVCVPPAMMASKRALAGRVWSLVVPVGSTQGQGFEPKKAGFEVR